MYLYAYSGKRASSRTVHLINDDWMALCGVDTIHGFERERLHTDQIVCAKCARIAREAA